MSILFTQYMLPNGKRRPVTIDLAPETEELAHELLDFGFKFDIEILTTGMIFMTCEHHQLHEPISLGLCVNGPGIDDFVRGLVEGAHGKSKEEFPELQQTNTGWRRQLAELEEERRLNAAIWDF